MSDVPSSQSILRHWREAEFSAGYTPLPYRLGLAAWAAAARRPRLYHTLARIVMPVLAMLGRRRGAFRRLPLAGGWTRHRDLPAPQGRTFQAQWADHKAGVPR